MKKEDFLKIVRSKMTKEPTEQELSFLGSMGEAIEQAFQADSVTRKKELETIATQLGSFEESETVAGVIRSLAAKVDDMEKKSQRSLSTDEKYRLKEKLMEKKDDILRAKQTNAPWEIEFKAKRGASAMMTAANVLTGASAINNVNVMDDLDIMVIQYPKNFIVDAIGGRQVAKVPQTLRWKEQTTESVDALGAVAEGAEKKLTDKLFVWKTATRLKYAGRIEFTEELAMDFDQLLLQIIDMFEQQVIRTWNAAIQAAIVAYAPAYVSSSLDDQIIEPNVSNVIAAGKLEIEVAGYEPNIVMMHPGDAALAMLVQNADGNQTFLPESIAFHGLTPFISNVITAGTIIVGTTSTISEQHSNFIIRRGVTGTQFYENEETIVGEVFSLLKLPTVSTYSWGKLVIATVKGLLQKGA